MTSIRIYGVVETNKVTDTESFIKKASLVHKNFYNYEFVSYTNSTTKVKIICPVHGEFMMRPASHCAGQGCKKCFRERNTKHHFHGTDKFIEKSRKVHGDFYDYSKVDYNGCYEKVDIICPKHGDFTMQACTHYRGHGCTACGQEKTKESLIGDVRAFVSKAEKIHKFFYNYSKVIYERSNIKAIVTCPKHGDFLVRPNRHLQGDGCVKCANERWKKAKYGKSKTMTLYHIRIFNEKTSFEKVGITTKTIKIRFNRLHLDGFQYEIIDSIEGTPDRLLDLEDEIMQHLDDNNERYRIRHLQESRTRGWSECFHEGLINLNDFTD